MSHGKFSISSLLHIDFQNTSNYFSKNTARNYLCPQGVVLGSKQMSRQNCRICNSQINRQYHLLWNQKCNSYTKEASLPLKRSPPGGDPYTAAFSPDPYTSLSPTTTTFSSSLESFASDLPSRGFSNQRQIENAQEDCTPTTNLTKKTKSIWGTYCRGVKTAASMLFESVSEYGVSGGSDGLRNTRTTQRRRNGFSWFWPIRSLRPAADDYYTQEHPKSGGLQQSVKEESLIGD